MISQLIREGETNKEKKKTKQTNTEKKISRRAIAFNIFN